MDSLQRLTQAVEYLRNNGKAKTQEVIAKDLGRNRTNIAKAMRGNPEYLTDDFLRDFAHVYSEYISEEWLVAGQGEMIKTLIPSSYRSKSLCWLYGWFVGRRVWR